MERFGREDNERRDADLPGEVWKPIEGFEADYAVSNMGRVRRSSAPRSGPTYPGKVLACPIAKQTGYRIVVLRRNGRNHWKTVHRLVCDAFLGERPDDKPEINHKDGNKADPRLENLEYCTRRENALHMTRVLKKVVGSANAAAKLTERDIPVIRRRLEAGESQAAIAKDYGVTQTTISRVGLGQKWGHVPQEHA